MSDLMAQGISCALRNQSSSAFKLLALLCGKEMIAKVSPASEHTSIPRTSQLGNASAWIGPQYSPSASQNYSRAIERWNDDGSADVIAVSLMTTKMPDGKTLDSGNRWVVTATREGEQWKVSNLLQVI